MGRLGRLVPDIEKTATLVQEISAAGREQDAGAQQVNLSIQHLDQVIQHNAITAEEMAETAEEFARQAEQLRGTTTFFKVAKTTSLMPASERGTSPLSSEISEKNDRMLVPRAEQALEKLDGLTAGSHDDRWDDEFERY